MNTGNSITPASSSPTGLAEFGPLTPDEKPQGYGFSLSKFFQRAVRGSSSPARTSSTTTADHPDHSETISTTSSRDSEKRLAVTSSSDTARNERTSSWLEKGVSESGGTHSDTVTSAMGKSGGGGAVSSGHDRTLPNVLTRIRNILDNRGSTPQQYKDSDFKQYWLPDSVSRECYECEEKFTTFRRRHHCRVCGQIFCSRCCNSMIPGKIIGYTGELRVCTYCCKVVLSYLQSSNLTADVLADLRALQDELLPPTPSQPPGTTGQDTPYSQSGPNTPLATPRGTLRRRPSLGFQEEKYATRTRYASGEFHGFVGQRESDQMTAERQLLLRDSHQLHSLWLQIVGGPADGGRMGGGGLPLASHRHRLKSFHNCFIGRDLVQWLLVNDKASSRASAVAIGQALLEAGYVVCISQPEQVFVDDYVLYRPLRQTSGAGGARPGAMEGPTGSQEGGQEPLWVKQLSSMTPETESALPEPLVLSNTGYDGSVGDPTHAVDTPTSIKSSSSSNYCLDLNFEENVVSIKKPIALSSPDTTDTVDTTTYCSGGGGGDSSTAFTTTVSAALSASVHLHTSRGEAFVSPTPPPPPASSTTTAATNTTLMAEEVLQALRQHDGQPIQTTGGETEEMGTQASEEYLIKQRLNGLWSSHETALLCQLLGSGGLSSSWADVILPIVHTVTDIIRPDVKNDSDEMDIRQYVQFKKVPGGSRSECQIVNGAVCTKNVSDKTMALRLTDPQILLIASTIDYHRGNDNKLLALDNLLLQEANYLQNVVAKIVSYKPDIILVEKSIAFLARKYLQAHGITLVMNVKPSVMERVARCTQAEVVTSIDAQLTRPTLGMCHTFYLRSYQLPGRNHNKTLMFFDGCATHLGCTVILRGATNSELKRVKRIMHFMIYAAYNWKLERAFLLDEYTMIAPLPSESFNLEDNNEVFRDEEEGVKDEDGGRVMNANVSTTATAAAASVTTTTTTDTTTASVAMTSTIMTPTITTAIAPTNAVTAPTSIANLTSTPLTFMEENLMQNSEITKETSELSENITGKADNNTRKSEQISGKHDACTGHLDQLKENGTRNNSSKNFTTSSPNSSRHFGDEKDTSKDLCASSKHPNQPRVDGLDDSVHRISEGLHKELGNSDTPGSRMLEGQDKDVGSEKEPDNTSSQAHRISEGLDRELGASTGSSESPAQVVAVQREKVSQTISDFSDPLHSYLKSGVSPQEGPLEPTRGSLSLAEPTTASHFRKVLDETILSCSPYVKYTVPYLESDTGGRNCILRRYFQSNLYVSEQLEKGNFRRRPRFSEMEAREIPDENQNVEFRPPHVFTKLKLTGDVTDQEIQAVLADFRARGGQMHNVCRCEKEKNKKNIDGVINGWTKNGTVNGKNRNALQASIELSETAAGLAVVEGLSVDNSGTMSTHHRGSSSQHSDSNQWSGQSSMMLTSEGRYDALHPFNHQRLSVLFSSYAQDSESPAFCVNPWVLTMDFYGRNDIPLGAFLEHYCFSATYTCPSSQCSVPVLEHTRKFVHDVGCVDVLLRRLDNPLEDPSSGAILMWSWCRVCRQVSPVRTMSLETWSLSFAKYLELRFYGGGLYRRSAPGCPHSLHHDHFQYFGLKNQVAVFKYNTITLREVALPPAQMKLCVPPMTQSSVVELIKGVAIKGYSVFSTILEKVTTLLSECGSRWEPLIVEISEHQNRQRAVFRGMIESIQLQLTSPTLEARRLHPPTPHTAQEVTHTMLAITDRVTAVKRHVAEVVADWNNKVQDLVHLRKKEEKIEKASGAVVGVSGGVGATSGGGGVLLRQSTSTSISTSSATSAHANTSSTGEMYSAHSQRQGGGGVGGDNASVASSAALTGLSSESLSLSASFSELPHHQDSPKMLGGEVGDDTVDDVAEAVSTPQSQAARRDGTVHAGGGAAALVASVECLMEERDRLLYSLPHHHQQQHTHSTSTQQQHHNYHHQSSTHSGTSRVSLSSALSEAGVGAGMSGWEQEGDVGGGLHAVTTMEAQQPGSDNTGVHRRQASDSCEVLVASGHSPTSGSPGRGHERSLSDGGQTSSPRDSVDRIAERRLASTAVKSIISTFWSSSANLMVESPFSAGEHYLLLPEVSVPVVVYGEEPSSIIAHALASQEYDRELSLLKKRIKEAQQKEGGGGGLLRSTDRDSAASESPADSSYTEETDLYITASAAASVSTTATTDTNTAATTDKGKAITKDLHIELQWNDQHAKFYCKIFFAEHFRQLRKMIFPYGEELYIRSLSRCILWEARGGKSGSVFCKSHDDRFILKEMSRFEMSSFLDFGPAYVQYIVNCEKEQQPTVLTRIVGVYRIGYKNTTTNKAQRMDVLVMENLFYQRNITHKFDLKGSIRNRLVNTSGKEESDLVLLDENLLRMACSSPLYVRPHSKTVLNRAIAADTVFLSQQLIMDYSLLVGIDGTANELVIGIIDYIRTFTWDKKLETIIKGSVLGGGAGRLPTVVSPEVYRTRFCHAMDRYFLLTPDRWTGLGLGVDP